MSTSTLGRSLHDPQAVLDYQIDWSAWLGTDTISTSTWTVPTGLTQPSASSHSDTTATVWLAGGTEGNSYTVTNHILTASGRQDDRSITITVAQR
jgi:hypothetical protein